VAYLELRVGDSRTLFGVGVDASIVGASMKAVLSALHRAGAALPQAAATA
jgi:2-isopropylmalate synthase